MDLQLTLDNVLIGIITLLGVIATFLLYYLTKKIDQGNKNQYRLDYYKAIKDSVNEFNSLVLSDDKNLKIIQHLENQHKQSDSPDYQPIILEDLEEDRKNWLCFYWLNNLEMRFKGIVNKSLDEFYGKIEFLNEELDILMADEKFFSLLKNGRGYDPKFKEYCISRRKDRFAIS